MLNFEDPAIKKQMNKLVQAKNSGLVKLTQEQLENIALYSKWKYEARKATLSPQKKAAIRKKTRTAVRAKKADPEQFGKTEHAALKARSKVKGYEFDLTADYIQGLFDACKGVCAQTGIAFDMNLGTKGKGNRNPLRPSVDRIDSTKGYVKDNVRIVLSIVNTMKADWPDEVVEKVVKAWAKKI